MRQGNPFSTVTVLAGSGQPLEPCWELDPISVSWQRCQLLFQVIAVDQESDGSTQVLRPFLGPAEPRELCLHVLLLGILSI